MAKLKKKASKTISNKSRIDSKFEQNLSNYFTELKYSFPKLDLIQPIRALEFVRNTILNSINQ